MKMNSHWYNHDNLGNTLKAKNNSVNQKMDAQNFLKVPNVSVNQEGLLFSPCRKVSNTSLGATSSSISSIRDGSLSYRVPWKFVILGDAGVGKSSLVKQYLNFGFSSQYNPTVEDNYIHNINLPDGTTNCVEILDTSGFYQFPAMKELNIRMGTGFILVFDLTNLRSLKNLVDLRKIILSIKQSEEVPIVLVGNKCDLIDSKNEAILLEKEFFDLIDSFKCVYIETSAKTNTNVDEIFKVLIELIIRENDDSLMNVNRRNSSISFVRRLSVSANRRKQAEQTRRFSEPAVVKKALPTKPKSKQSSEKESGKSTPLFRRKQKNCTIS